MKLNDEQIRKRDTEAKLKRKLYADKKTGAKQSKTTTGDNVLVKQPKKNKLTPPFNPTPGKVLKKKGSMVTVRHKDRNGYQGRFAFQTNTGYIGWSRNNESASGYDSTTRIISSRAKATRTIQRFCLNKCSKCIKRVIIIPFHVFVLIQVILFTNCADFMH